MRTDVANKRKCGDEDSGLSKTYMPVRDSPSSQRSCSRACGLMHYHMPGLVSCPALLQGQPA